jgi:hypothetical protein
MRVTPRRMKLAILVLFALCTVQFSIAVGAEGVTANYLYIIIPVIFGILKIRRLIAREEIFWIIAFYCIIYLAGVPSDLFKCGR